MCCDKKETNPESPNYCCNEGFTIYEDGTCGFECPCLGCCDFNCCDELDYFMHQAFNEVYKQGADPS